MLSNCDQNSVFSITAGTYHLPSISVDTCKYVGRLKTVGTYKMLQKCNSASAEMICVSEKNLK